MTEFLAFLLVFSLPITAICVGAYLAINHYFFKRRTKPVDDIVMEMLLKRRLP